MFQFGSRVHHLFLFLGSYHRVFLKSLFEIGLGWTVLHRKKLMSSLISLFFGLFQPYGIKRRLIVFSYGFFGCGDLLRKSLHKSKLMFYVAQPNPLQKGSLT